MDHQIIETDRNSKYFIFFGGEKIENAPVPLLHLVRLGESSMTHQPLSRPKHVDKRAPKS